MPAEDTYVQELIQILRTYNLELRAWPRKIGSFTPDILAKDKRTGYSVVVEVKSHSPILTNVVQALAYSKKHLPGAYFIAFSPQGTYPDVKEMADKEGIWIVSSVDEFRARIERLSESATPRGTPP